jgi:putative glutamine amidotransferase
MSCSRPLIGITGPRIHAAEIISTPSILLHLFSDTYYAHYAQAVARAGGLAVQIPRDNPPTALVARLDGIVIAGGQDVDPRMYGHQPSTAATRLDPGRDRFEARLIRAALDQDKPLLGICRGAQLLNVTLGGTLLENLTDVGQIEHTVVLYPPDARVHPVKLTPGSILHDVYGDATEVNSFHRQSIWKLGERVQATGRAPDGVIEGIEVGGARAVGVQWHPEALAEVDPLLAWLIDTATTTGSATPKGVPVEHCS